MKKRVYRIHLEPEPEGGFTVTVPLLPGCVTWGKDYEDALAMAREAIAGYLEVLVEQGKPIPEEAASRLPSITPREVAAALKRAGFQEKRQRGSHLILYHPQRDILVTVPMHARELPRGTLKAIIREAGFTEEEFRAFL